MAKKAKAYVLDAWAVMSYLEDEPSGEKVEELIASAHEEQIPIYMSVIKRIQVENVGWEITQEAARIKSQHKMSYADAFAAALAKVMKADLVTGDGEFKSLDGEIKILWV